MSGNNRKAKKNKTRKNNTGIGFGPGGLPHGVLWHGGTSLSLSCYFIWPGKGDGKCDGWQLHSELLSFLKIPCPAGLSVNQSVGWSVGQSLGLTVFLSCQQIVILQNTPL